MVKTSRNPTRTSSTSWPHWVRWSWWWSRTCSSTRPRSSRTCSCRARGPRRFPLILTTGRILSQYNVGAQTRRTANIAWHQEDVLEIHPHDAEVRGIEDGDEVTLASRVGATTLHAQISDRMPTGVVYTTFHYPVTGANVVTTENSDWATNCPEYKVTAVQVAVAHPISRQRVEPAVERVLAVGLVE